MSFRTLLPELPLPARRLALLVLLCCTLGACSAPPSNKISIVGAKLLDNAGKQSIEYSVVVIADGRIQSVGRQSDVPVPKEGELVSGMNSVITPLEGNTVEEGKPANLKITGTVNREMRNGVWVN